MPQNETILIPVLSETEHESSFLDKALGGTKQIILLVVVDTGKKEKFGFTAAYIQKARAEMEEVKREIGKRRKTAEDLLEWGDTERKIINIALLRKADRVVLKKQDNHYFKQLVKRLKEEKITTTVI